MRALAAFEPIGALAPAERPAQSRGDATGGDVGKLSARLETMQNGVDLIAQRLDGLLAGQPAQAPRAEGDVTERLAALRERTEANQTTAAALIQRFNNLQDNAWAEAAELLGQVGRLAEENRDAARQMLEAGAALSHSAQAASNEYRTAIRTALTAVLTRAEDRGEIAPGSAATDVEVLLPWMLGMAVVARSGARPDEVARYFAAGRELIAGWRLH